MRDLFSVPVFFISFREALEAGIIVSVLIAILDKTLIGTEDAAALRKSLIRQIWLGTAVGVLLCIVMGAIIIGGFLTLAADVFGSAEDIWEAVFSLVASLVITITGAVLLRVGKLQATWSDKLSKAVIRDREDAAEGSSPRTANVSFMGRFTEVGEKYALFILPLITILREGFEGVLFIAGVILGSPVSTIPLSVIAGIVTGVLISYLIYKGSNISSVQYFLLIPTCLLYLIAAGLFSKGIWHLEAHEWNQVVGGDAAELGSGPGSYDIRRSVWHVNCCNPNLNGGGFWGILNAVLGWQNSATVGSVVSYNLYWVAMALGFFYMIRRDKNRSKAVATEVAREDGAREPLLVDGE